jgi:hypothetical protein
VSGVEPGPAANIKREVAEYDSPSANHLDDRGLGRGHHHDIVEIQIGISRL